MTKLKMDVALSVEKAPAEQVADAYKALEERVAQAKRDVVEQSKATTVDVPSPASADDVVLALQLRASIKQNGLERAINLMSVKERGEARRLIRTALAFYVSGGKLS